MSPSPVASRDLHGAPEVGRRRLGRVGDREQLEVAAAERHDPVVGADALVAPAAARGDAEDGLDPRRGGIEVGTSRR